MLKQCTVRELAAALAALPADQQDLPVCAENYEGGHDPISVGMEVRGEGGYREVILLEGEYL